MTPQGVPRRAPGDCAAALPSSAHSRNAWLLGRPATGGDEPLEHADGRVGVDPPPALDRERLTRVLVDDMKQRQDAAVGGLVEPVVERPHLVGTLGR